MKPIQIEKVGFVQRTKMINGFLTVLNHRKYRITIFNFIEFYVTSPFGD